MCPMPRSPIAASVDPTKPHADPSPPGRSLEDIRHYYGEVLSSHRDLKTGACCAPGDLSPRIKELVSQLHPEVTERFFGCGTPIPPAVQGSTVLDLGCGAGRDAYLISELVGESGRVIGVDMTDEQLAVARTHRDWHRERFGHHRSNVEFHLGFIEDLATVGIDDNSVDVVVSNCVVNLSPNKRQVLTEVFRVLKPGGEFLFSDVFSDRRIPHGLRDDPVVLGECLAGAFYREDFRRLMAGMGCADVREVSNHPVELLDPEIEEKIGMVRFHSRTFRVFKLPLEDRCEDYGQVACYRGTIPGHPHAFDLDDHHHFERGRPIRVCGNTARMLSLTRLAPHFEVDGDESVHYGLFSSVPDQLGEPPGTAACC
jgi:arsenite methyltransferase